MITCQGTLRVYVHLWDMWYCMEVCLHRVHGRHGENELPV